MTHVVLDALAEALLEVTREVDAPAEPFGYGTDISCTTDLDERMSEVDPASTRAIAEALVRRLDTSRGALIDDPDYGLDLKIYCNRGVTADDLLALAERVRLEVTQDDRVSSAAVSVTGDGSALAVEIRVTPDDPETGEFSFTLAITSSAVAMEAVT